MPVIKLVGPNIRGATLDEDVPLSVLDLRLERWVKEFQARGYKVTKCAPYLFDISTIGTESHLVGIFFANGVV